MSGPVFASVDYSYPDPGTAPRLGHVTINLTPATGRPPQIRITSVEVDAFGYVRERLSAVEPLLRGTPVYWGNIGTFERVGGEDTDTPDTNTPLSLRATLEGDTITLDAVRLDGGVTEDGRFPDSTTVTPTDIEPVRVEPVAFVEATLDAADQFVGHEDRTPALSFSDRLTDARSILAAYRENDTLPPLPFERSMDDIRTQLFGDDRLDDHTRRYLLETDVLDRIVAEIRGRDDARDRYHELGMLTDEAVLSRALDALAANPDPDAVDGLLQVFWANDPAVTPQATRILGRIGTERVRDELCRRAKSGPEPSLRLAAVEALAEYDDEAVRETLAAVAETDADPTVRTTAREALDG